MFEADHDRLHQSGEPCSLLLIDIDYFHSYNEIYGYLAGHEALRKLGEAISQSMRTGDDTYIGGVEFAVLLPVVHLFGAKEIGARVRRAVERRGIEHRGCPDGVLTVCVGRSRSRRRCDSYPMRSRKPAWPSSPERKPAVIAWSVVSPTARGPQPAAG